MKKQYGILTILFWGSLISIFFLACSKDHSDTLHPNDSEKSTEDAVYLENTLNDDSIVVIQAKFYSTYKVEISDSLVLFVLRTTAPAKSDIFATLRVDAERVEDFNRTNNKEFQLLPTTAYNLKKRELSINTGSSKSESEGVLQINKDELEKGKKYLLPIGISNLRGGETASFKRIVYVRIDVEDASTPVVEKEVKQIVYVEVNNHNPLNAGSYFLTGRGVPFFDVVNIFAANINYDETKKKRYVYFNPHVENILSNKDRYIVPLQEKGIKVVLSLLNNHQGVGFDNFTSKSEISDFALQVKQIVEDYGLDGIDIDDEYAKYGTNGQPGVNDSSLVLLVKRLREIMPDKIISLFYYSDAISIPNYSKWKNWTVGQYIDYAYQGVYGWFSPPNIAGLTDKAKIGPYSVNLSSFKGVSTLKKNAKKAKNENYKIFMWYDLTSVNRSSWFSTVAEIFYGEKVGYTGEAF